MIRSQAEPCSTRIATVFIGCVAVLAFGCQATSDLGPPNDGRVALGTWGGDTSGFIVGDTAAHLHISCTYGDVSGRIPLDANGDFDVNGSYVLRAYPVAVGPTVPARFVGHLNGSTLTVTAIVDDTVQHQVVVRGPVMMKYGDDPRLGPCPICRRPILSR